MLDILIASIGFGIATAAILTIAAVGFTLQFSVTNIFNLAFADVMTFSAFIAFALNRAGMNIWLTVPIAGIGGAIISFLINRGILQPMLRRGTGLFGMMITTIAVSLIIWNGILTIVRPGYFHYLLPKEITFRFAGQILTATQLITIGIALVAMIIINMLLRYTKLGKSMRAVAENPDLARSSGIPSRQVVDLTWIISGFLCGIAGAILCINLPVFSTVTARGLLIVILASVVLGGVGNPYGAILGALILGISSELIAAVFAPQWKDVFSFVILVLILLVRPQGIIPGNSAGKAAL